MGVFRERINVLRQIEREICGGGKLQKIVRRSEQIGRRDRFRRLQRRSARRRRHMGVAIAAIDRRQVAAVATLIVPVAVLQQRLGGVLLVRAAGHRHALRLRLVVAVGHEQRQSHTATAQPMHLGRGYCAATVVDRAADGVVDDDVGRVVGAALWWATCAPKKSGTGGWRAIGQRWWRTDDARTQGAEDPHVRLADCSNIYRGMVRRLRPVFTHIPQMFRTHTHTRTHSHLCTHTQESVTCRPRTTATSTTTTTTHRR